MKEYITYQVVLSYRCEVDSIGKMIGKPELLKGYIPRHLKKVDKQPKQAVMEEAQSVIEY